MEHSVQYCSLCNNILEVEESEYCHECTVIINQSIRKEEQSKEQIERRTLMEQQDREFRDSLHADKRKASGIKRCDICIEDYIPLTTDQTLCQKCLNIVGVSKSDSDEEEEEEKDIHEDLPNDREKRAAMLAMQYERLFSNKN
jgi:hypothetical protein